MKAHPVFWHARLDRLKLLAEQAPPGERARLEGSIWMLTRAIETMAKCREAVERQQFSFSVSRRFLDGVMERRLG
jgi:hypothetical protein